MACNDSHRCTGHNTGTNDTAAASNGRGGTNRRNENRRRRSTQWPKIDWQGHSVRIWTKLWLAPSQQRDKRQKIPRYISREGNAFSGSLLFVLPFSSLPFVGSEPVGLTPMRIPHDYGNHSTNLRRRSTHLSIDNSASANRRCLTYGQREIRRPPNDEVTVEQIIHAPHTVGTTTVSSSLPPCFFLESQEATKAPRTLVRHMSPHSSVKIRPTIAQ